MFGISFTELVLILVVALVVLGPERLPGMLRTVGLWIHKVRRMTTEVRAQTGIDDLLRQEGFSGGLAEVRSLLRGDPRSFLHGSDLLGSNPAPDPYASHDSLENPGNLVPIDVSRERPVEGPDSYGAVPEDLIDEGALARAEQQRADVIGSPGSVEAAGATSPSATEGSDALDPPNPDPVRSDEPHSADNSSRKPGGADE
ncbi:MAG TPA: Sec-independent protein translocase protein TatB [Polyangiaceae bacterium]|nr:Sec-independent protein translocase protein TatB [Polyangiaceae bacterium]